MCLLFQAVGQVENQAELCLPYQVVRWGGFAVSSANEGKLEINDKIILQFEMDSKRSNWLFPELIFV